MDVSPTSMLSHQPGPKLPGVQNLGEALSYTCLPLTARKKPITPKRGRCFVEETHCEEITVFSPTFHHKYNLEFLSITPIDQFKEISS